MDCLFCKIVKKEIPAKIAYEDDKVIVFHDINPQAPMHLLIIPKKHVKNVSELSNEDTDLVGYLHTVAKDLAKNLGYANFRLVTNNGAGAGQSVWHLHFHFLAGRPLAWPPG